MKNIKKQITKLEKLIIKKPKNKAEKAFNKSVFLAIYNLKNYTNILKQLD